MNPKENLKQLFVIKTGGKSDFKMSNLSTKYTRTKSDKTIFFKLNTKANHILF